MQSENKSADIKHSILYIELKELLGTEFDAELYNLRFWIEERGYRRYKLDPEFKVKRLQILKERHKLWKARQQAWLEELYAEEQEEEYELQVAELKSDNNHFYIERDYDEEDYW